MAKPIYPVYINMAHINDTALRAVYGIIDHDNRTFYIGKTLPHRVGKTYSEHLHGRVRKTREMFENADMSPVFYVLECGEMSTAVAFRHCVAWTRYFLDQGYNQAFPDILADYADDMLPETQEIYKLIQGRPLDEVLASENALRPPKQMHLKDKKSACTQLSLRFTPAEYAHVKTIANEHNFQSATAYCKHMSIAGRVIDIDIQVLCAYTAEFRNIKTLLRQILLSIYKTGKYYSADMENIQKCIDRMIEIHGQALDAIANLVEIIRSVGYEDLLENE